MRELSIFIFVIGAFACTIKDNEASEIIKVTKSCAFSGPGRIGDLMTYDPSTQATEKFGVLLAAAGIDSGRVSFRSAALPEKGLAVIDGNKRYIVYDISLMSDIDFGGASKWRAYALLAHEIGHYVNQDDDLGSNPEIELRRDEYAGSLLQRLGAAHEDVREAFNGLLANVANVTDSELDKRIAAALAGWTKERDRSYLNTPVIKITGARYGHDPDSWHRIVERVQRECERKFSCAFPMTNAWLGYDPFPGQSKRARITYDCVAGGRTIESKDVWVNEGQQATLFCW